MCAYVRSACAELGGAGSAPVEVEVHARLRARGVLVEVRAWRAWGLRAWHEVGKWG